MVVTRLFRAGVVVAGLIVLTACSPPSSPPEEAPTATTSIEDQIAAKQKALDDGPSQADRENQFWVTLQTRTGMLGRDYADPVKAKTGSIHYGHYICGALRGGIDPGVFVSQSLSAGRSTRTEIVVQVNTAVEFLCPDQPKVS